MYIVVPILYQGSPSSPLTPAFALSHEMLSGKLIIEFEFVVVELSTKFVIEFKFVVVEFVSSSRKR